MIILEIPHRLPPIVWEAKDEVDFISRVSQSAVKSDGVIDSYATAYEYLEHDLRALFVFRDEGDIVDRLHTIPSAYARSLLGDYL
jgi:hypothetical protein